MADALKRAWVSCGGIVATAAIVVSAHAQVIQLPPGTQGRGSAPAVDCKQLEEAYRSAGSGASAGGFDLRGLMALMGCRPPAEARQEKSAPTADCRIYRDVLADLEGVNSDWLGPLPVMAARALAERCGDTGASGVEQKARAGLLRFGEGRFSESAEAFRDAAQATSDTERMRYIVEMGKSLLAAGRTNDAQKIFAGALTGVPAGSAMRVELLVLLGIVALETNDVPSALDRLLEAEKITQARAQAQRVEVTFNPAFYRHAPYLGMALQRAGRTDEARAILDRIIRGREQFVGMADQTQQMLPMMQQAMGSLGLGNLLNSPETTRGFANIETSKLMMGEILALNLACSLLEEINLGANLADNALEVAERCRGRALARLLANRAFHRIAAAALPSHAEIEAYARQHRMEYGKAGQELTKERMSNPQAEAASRPATIADIRRMAAERKATLVVYSIVYAPDRLPNRMPDRETGITIWVVAPEGSVAVRRKSFDGALPEGTLSLTSAALRAHEALGVPGRGASANPSTDRGQPRTNRAMLELRRFYRLLIEPVEDLLPAHEGARLLFVPQGPLFLVPFAALENSQGAPLIGRYSISVTPSLQTLALTAARRQASRATGPALIVGNPVMPRYSSAPGKPPIDIPPLPGAEEEATAIAKLLKTTPMTGAAATKATVMSRARDARFVHLATHGFLDDSFDQGQQGVNPNLREIMMLENRPDGGHKTPGMLALAPSGSDSGMLTADEIAQATTGAELVVMSACGSGQGAINDDGVIGLSRAWMAAGAPSVVVSLWAIPDEPTRDLMVELYRQLGEGRGKAEALRAAMLATRAKYPNPLNWAAFVLLGEPD
jgi:CHAT domain-containing protein/tetratricopeptide (TPR) repeat protein